MPEDIAEITIKALMVPAPWSQLLADDADTGITWPSTLNTLTLPDYNPLLFSPQVFVEYGKYSTEHLKIWLFFFFIVSIKNGKKKIKEKLPLT